MEEKSFSNVNFLDVVVDDLEKDEGFRSFIYDDATGKPVDFSSVCKGKPTIGIGFNLAPGIDKTLARRICRIQVGDIHARLFTSPWYKTQPLVVKAVVLNIAFNVGVGGLLKFRRLIRAISIGNFKTAAAEIRDSAAWRGATHERYERLALRLENL